MNRGAVRVKVLGLLEQQLEDAPAQVIDELATPHGPLEAAPGAKAGELIILLLYTDHCSLAHHYNALVSRHGEHHHLA